MSDTETRNRRQRTQTALLLVKIAAFFGLLISLLVIPRRYWLWALLAYAVVAGATWMLLIAGARRAQREAERRDES